jgi:hypothetical protein
MGSARSAILLLECIEKYFGHPIFQERDDHVRKHHVWERPGFRGAFVCGGDAQRVIIRAA